jgi:integrase
MEGGIYAEDKCPKCGKAFKHHPKFGFICVEDGTESKRVRVRFRGIRKRFNSYEPAFNFLAGLRFKAKEGSFDKRDYSSDNPLGFENYAIKYLKTKEKLKSYKDVERDIWKAVKFFGQQNVKAIQFAEIEDFLMSLDNLSEKTKHNILSSIHSFFVWVCKRAKIFMPEFPKVSFKLGWRNIVSPQEQDAILEEVHRISYRINPKVWIGIKWLMTYISIRPGELVAIKEGDFDFNLDAVLIKDPKEPKAKTVPLRHEDADIVKSFPKAMPHLYFFRHVAGVSGVKAGEPFGGKYLYKWWKKACSNLGIKDVDLYGGTRHSTARAMRLIHSPEQIKRATMHSTNKAFERYFQIELEDVRELYDMGTIRGQHLSPNKDPKVLNFKK